MSVLLAFHLLQGPNSKGRKLDEIRQWSDEELEECHDFIQWMFPLDEPSAFNAEAPLVSEADREAFRADPRLQKSMRRSLAVFLGFLGLAIAEDGRIIRGGNFGRRSSIWNHRNHNWLRITRVLKSLRLLGLEDEARALWRCLKDLHETDGLISEDSFAYWRHAAGLDGK